MRWVVALLALGGIAACGPWTTRACLKSDTARTKFVREGWREATDPSGSWQTRICATESVITHYSDAEGRDPPACTEEIIDRFESEVFRRSPVANNRLQLARIHGISVANEIVPIMPAKADAVIRLAALRPEDIAEYELTPGERGPPLGKAMFRRLALRGLASTHLAMNQKEVRAAAIARRRISRDAIDRRLLEGVTADFFEHALWGHPTVAVDNGSFAVFDQILAETTAALERDYEEVEHGLLLDHLQLMALRAKAFGRELPASRLFRSIIDRKARVASVRGKPGARRDLFVAAVMAEAECHHDHKDLISLAPRWYEEPSRTLDEIVFEPALYDRGFDCRGQTLAQLQLPGFLERLAQGTLSPGPELSRDGAALLRLLPDQPQQVTARPDVRALLLNHPRELQALDQNDLRDPLRPVHLAVAASEAEDPTARAFLMSYLDRIRERPATHERDLLLVARHAKAFGLDAEVRVQADAFAAHGVKESPPPFDAVIAEGVRASLEAATFEPW